jgi:hypothetical protein
MNTLCKQTKLNTRRPEYPIPSIDSLFLPRFPTSINPNALASMDARPNVPPQYANRYIPAPMKRTSGKTFSLPSGIGNYDRNSIRQFDNMPRSKYPNV